mmetsp:Transcript_32550/g.45157  ORF Transcript_32550/g.45157 Transcript_32550/m.45157 type:complete len:321 (-) Transcript_32550:175-1137(-)
MFSMAGGIMQNQGGFPRAISMPDLTQPQPGSPIVQDSPTFAFEGSGRGWNSPVSLDNSPHSGILHPFLPRHPNHPFQAEIPLDDIVRLLEVNQQNESFMNSSPGSHNSINKNSALYNNLLLTKAAAVAAGVDRRWHPSRLCNMTSGSGGGQGQGHDTGGAFSQAERLRHEASLAVFGAAGQHGLIPDGRRRGMGLAGMDMADEGVHSGASWSGNSDASASPRSDQVSAKRMSRIMANRLSAAKSRVKKLQQTADLEQQVRALQSEMAKTHTKTEMCKEKKGILEADIAKLQELISSYVHRKQALDKSISLAQEEMQHSES